MFDSELPILLIPVHVPAHWCLVAIHKTDRAIHFFDSLCDRVGAKADEDRAREEVELALKLLGGDTNGEWGWISERVH